MAALPPVPKTAKITYLFSDGSGANIENGIYVKYTGVVGSTDAATILTAVSASWNTRMAPVHCSNLSLLFLEFNDLDSVTGAQETISTTHKGTVSAVSVTSGACMVVSGLASIKFRGGHCRIYLPSCPTSNLQDSNTWQGTFLTTVATNWTNHMLDVNGSGTAGSGSLSVVLAQRFTTDATLQDPPGTGKTLKPRPRKTPLTWPINAWRTNPQVGSQRRRNQTR